MHRLTAQRMQPGCCVSVLPAAQCLLQCIDPRSQKLSNLSGRDTWVLQPQHHAAICAACCAHPPTRTTPPPPPLPPAPAARSPPPAVSRRAAACCSCSPAAQTVRGHVLLLGQAHSQSFAASPGAHAGSRQHPASAAAHVSRWGPAACAHARMHATQEHTRTRGSRTGKLREATHTSELTDRMRTSCVATAMAGRPFSVNCSRMLRATNSRGSNTPLLPVEPLSPTSLMPICSCRERCETGWLLRNSSTCRPHHSQVQCVSCRGGYH